MIAGAFGRKTDEIYSRKKYNYCYYIGSQIEEKQKAEGDLMMKGASACRPTQGYVVLLEVEEEGVRRIRSKVYE